MMFDGLSNHAAFVHERQTYLHFVRHPANMVVSGYMYHRRCPEAWTDSADILHGAPNISRSSGPGREAARLTQLFFGQDAARQKVGDLLTQGEPSARHLSYCALLQARNESSGIRAEVVRSMSAADGVRRMLIDRLRLQQSGGQLSRAASARLRRGGGKRALGRLVEVCLSEVTPPGSARARSAWVKLAAQLNRSGKTFDPKLMGRSYENHRSQGHRCSKLRLARMARAALVELYGDWLARLHGYRDAAEFGVSSGDWDALLGGACPQETEEEAEELNRSTTLSTCSTARDVSFSGTDTARVQHASSG